jgi:23S rRNA pseudouridine1911/1915/1917 synthase
MNKGKQNFVVESDYVNFRADKYLAVHLPEISRSKIKTLMQAGQIKLNNIQFEDCSYKVQLGDSFDVIIKKQRAEKVKARDIPFTVIYEDEHLLVIDKPAGLTVHPGAGNYDNTLVNALLFYCGDSLSSISGEARPGIVHRLDKDTSGLMLVAKSDIVHSNLAEQLEKRKIKRVYHALVYGIVTPIAGKISVNIGRNKSNHKIMSVMKAGGKTAVTYYRLLNSFFDTLSLVECVLETGRTHQIRVHMQYKKHPVVGDPTYAKGYNFNLAKLPEEAKKLILGLNRQALHAKELSFIHPITQQALNFTSNYPKELNDVIKTLLN